MKWKKYTIYTTTEAEDIVSLMLNENGVEGVQIENNVPLSEADTKGMFIDILPELGADDGTSRVSFFLRLADIEGADAQTSGHIEGAAAGCCADTAANGSVSDLDRGSSAGKAQSDASEDRSYTIEDRIWTEAEITALLDTVRTELDSMRSYTDVGEGRIEEGTTEDTDWRDNWKQFFKPILIGDFLIKPSWEDIPDEDAAGIEEGSIKVIEIDPGTAFGTGSHETTQLCITELDKIIQDGDKVLDIGTGSGILGIAALKCGAAAVMATELDEMCEPSIKDNISYNGIDDSMFRLIIGNVISDESVIAKVRAGAPQGYDVVIANILAPVIIMLAAPGQVDALIRKDGTFICSGIIDTRTDEVTAAFKANPNWEITRIEHKGEWVGITARRR